MKIKGYAETIAPIMLEHGLITEDDEQNMKSYLNETMWSEENV